MSLDGDYVSVCICTGFYKFGVEIVSLEVYNHQILSCKKNILMGNMAVAIQITHSLQKLYFL